MFIRLALGIVLLVATLATSPATSTDAVVAATSVHGATACSAAG